MLYLPIYLLLFYIVEHVVTPESDYWVSWCAVDNWIPFVRQFSLVYVLWYPLMIGMALWLIFKNDRDVFLRYAWSAIIGLTASIVTFFVFPSGQDLRPVVVEGNDIAAMLVRWIYTADTNTNVLPSMHVVGTLAAMVAAFESKSIKKAAKWGIVIVGVLINASTVLIKQHSILDIGAGIIYYAVIYLAIYVIPKRHREKTPSRS